MENQSPIIQCVTVLDRVIRDLGATQRALADGLRQAQQTGNPMPFLLEVVRIHDDISRTMEWVSGVQVARARLEKP